MDYYEGLPIPLRLDGKRGTSERLEAVWNLQLPPVQKLVAIYVANGVGDGSMTSLAKWAGVTVEQADAIVTVLIAEGVLSR